MTSKDNEAPDDDVHASDKLAEVLQGCCAGDRDAQQQLYELYHAQVYRLAARMVGREEAQDVVQQVFLQLFQKIGKFAGHARFDTWLYRLATNEALQYLRKRKRWTFDTLAVDPASSRDPKRDRHEHSELLEAALGRLEPDLRAIFVLKELEKLSYRDIASSIGIPEGTVGSRLNRARRELQKHLADLGWEA
jgi:RNA polymerase sigma-70 factor (ECF subfamily)